MEPGFIGIIGGMGRMGRLMTRLFERAGQRVRIFDLENGPPDWRAAGECRVLVLAVPLPAMAQTCAALGPHTRLDGAVIDIGSVKEEPLRLMMDHCRGEVIGGHPLFGPQTDSFDGHTFFLCPGRVGPVYPWLKDLLTGQGLNPVEMEPAVHDRSMAVVQLLRHMLLFSFGLTLDREGLGPDQGPNETGPWFQALVEMLGRQISLGPDLYADLAAHNPHTARISEAFLNAAQSVARAYGSRNRERIIDCIKDVFPDVSGSGQSARR